MKDRSPATMSGDIWVLVRHRFGVMEESSLGLIAEAKRFRTDKSKITAIAPEAGSEAGLEAIRGCGVDRALLIKGLNASCPRGEILAGVLSALARQEKPSFVLMVQSQDTMELGSRLAASLEAAFVTRAMDLNVDGNGTVAAVRSVANGRLFEEVEFQCGPPFIVSFLPSVLSVGTSEPGGNAKLRIESMEGEFDGLRTKLISTTRLDAEQVDLEEADIVVSGGRGVGPGKAFQIMHDLASVLGGIVGCTRPVVDQKTLPFDRQIGQTGKTVSPRLLFACGISGANEFTAGMEKSQLVVAVNSDPQARIFRFADLGVVGNVQEVIPLLIERIKEIKRN